MSRLKGLFKCCEVCCPYKDVVFACVMVIFLFFTFLVYLTKLFYFFFHDLLCYTYVFIESTELPVAFGFFPCSVAVELCVCVSIRHM